CGGGSRQDIRRLPFPRVTTGGLQWTLEWWRVAHGCGRRARDECCWLRRASALTGAGSGVSRRGSIDAAAQDVEPADPACLLAELQRQESGPGGDVGGHVAALDCVRARERDHALHGATLPAPATGFRCRERG